MAAILLVRATKLNKLKKYANNHTHSNKLTQNNLEMGSSLIHQL